MLSNIKYISHTYNKLRIFIQKVKTNEILKAFAIIPPCEQQLRFGLNIF